MILGIDPGASGAAAVIGESVSSAEVCVFKHNTEHDVADWLFPRRTKIEKAYLEAVHAMPRQGVTSTFKFGTNYGFWRGLLVAYRIPFECVTPLKWQTVLNCRTGGNKNISKARAQEIFPGIKITHATADALLIAVYGRTQKL